MSLFNQININGVALNGLQGQPTQAFANQFGNIAQMNIQCHPDMKGFLPHIAAYIHNFIAQRPLRICLALFTSTCCSLKVMLSCSS